MGDTGIAQGHVYGWTDPDNKKAPHKCFVGGIELTVWRTEKDEDGDYIKNPFVKDFKDAIEAKRALKVKYEINEREFNGKKYTDHLPVGLKASDDDDAVAKGDAASEKAAAEKAAKQGSKGGRGSYDETGQLARWAVSHAIEALPEGVSITEDKTRKNIVKMATVLGLVALEVQAGIKDGAAKAQGKGPQNSAAESEPEPKNALADAF